MFVLLEKCKFALTFIVISIMEASIYLDEHKDIFAEEMLKYVLKAFGIIWEPELKEVNPPKLPLKYFYASCVLLSEAVTTGWQKFYAAVEQESCRIHKNFMSSASIEDICESLKEVSDNLNLPKEFILFVVLAIFGDLCVRISKSGAEHLISTAVSGAKKYIVDEDLAKNMDLQINAVQFMEFCDNKRFRLVEHEHEL